MYSRKLAHTTRQFPAILQPNPKFSERLEGQLDTLKQHLMQKIFLHPSQKNVFCLRQHSSNNRFRKEIQGTRVDGDSLSTCS